MQVFKIMIPVLLLAFAGPALAGEKGHMDGGDMGEGGHMMQGGDGGMMNMPMMRDHMEEMQEHMKKMQRHMEMMQQMMEMQHGDE